MKMLRIALAGVALVAGGAANAQGWGQSYGPTYGDMRGYGGSDRPTAVSADSITASAPS